MQTVSSRIRTCIVVSISQDDIYYNMALYIYSEVTYTAIGKRLLVGWLVGIYGISTIVGYLTPNPFLWE